jgi:ATP-binding cassette subfamily F protein 3
MNGKKAPKAKPKTTAPSKNQQARAAKLERQIEAAEAALRTLEEELADPSAWVSPSASERNTARHEQAKKRVEELMSRWETVAG